MRLRDKTILLTGATSGIGRSLVAGLDTSSRIIAVGREGSRATALRHAYPNLTFVECDLAGPCQIENLIATVLEGHQIDGLIHCAAIQNTPHLLAPEFDLDAVQKEIAVNFTAFVHLTARLLPSLARREQAFVLAVNSGLGLVPKRDSAVYCATKGALDLFCQSLRAQLRNTPITVMQAFLPLVDTPMTAGRGAGKMSPDDVAARIIDGIERGLEDHDIGKVKVLRTLRRASPALARRIMERG